MGVSPVSVAVVPDVMAATMAAGSESASRPTTYRSIGDVPEVSGGVTVTFMVVAVTSVRVKVTAGGGPSLTLVTAMLTAIVASTAVSAVPSSALPSLTPTCTS